MTKDVALILQCINLALCGGWTYYDILNDNPPFEPVIIFISASIALAAWKKKEPAENKSKTPQGAPTILGSNDRKTNPRVLVGRKGLLKALRTVLQKHGKAALINGMGGIGKTTLAEAYVYQYGPKYDHILWIEQTEEQLEEDFISDQTLLEQLKITNAVEDKRELFRQILQKLKTVKEENNLLIIDNAEPGLERYLELLPGHPQWHVLATSRHHMEGMHPLPLDFLSEEEAIQLFNQESEEKLDQALVRELVKMVEYHTLSITLLAKTARHYDSDLERLKKVFDEDLQTKVYLKHAKDQVGQVKAYLISIFSLNNLSEDQIWLLQQFVCLPPDYYDHDWLKDWVQPEGHRADQFNPLLSALSDQGWLMTRKLHAQQWKLHRLIREVLLDKHPPKEESVLSLIQSVTSLLYMDQTKDNPVDKFQWVPYGRVIVDLFQSSVHEQMSALQSNLAMVLEALGDYQGARELLEKAMASNEINFGTDHPTTAVSYSNLATVLQYLGDYDGAMGLLEKAVASAEKISGPDHPTTAVFYSNLATVLKALGDYQGAKGFLEKAIASDEKNFGTEHPTTAVSYSNLATILKDLGDYDGAMGLLEKAVAPAEKISGPDHPTTAVFYSNLATVLKALGDYQGAKGLLEKAKASDEKNFGTDHPTTAGRYSNLALVLQALGDYEGAKGLLQRAMASDEKNFGTDHPDTARSYSNLAVVLKALGDFEGAKGLLQRAMDSDEKNFGPDHPSTARSYSNLATVLQDLGDYERAKGLMEKAVVSAEKNFGPDHPTTAVCYSNLALVLKALGDYERALTLAEKAQKVWIKAYPVGHPNIQTIKDNIAAIKAKMEG